MILRELQVYGGDGPFLVFFEKKTTKPTGGQLCKRVRRILKNSALQRHSQVTSKVTAALLPPPPFYKANKQKKNTKGLCYGCREKQSGRIFCFQIRVIKSEELSES
jgi:hypothetical protein